MACASDTESDSDTVTGRPAFHDTNADSDVGVPSFEAVRSAIECLNERDVPSIVEDKPYFQELPKLLLTFLDRVPQLMSVRHVPEVTRIFSQLGTFSFLQRLLDLRRFVRLAEQVGSKSLVITWIDVVLAKLGSLATSIIVGLAAGNLEKEAEWIQFRREDGTIRAATQLPDSWKAMVAVMGSSSFSPAARRLATSLCFVAYIMVRQIVSDKTWPREGPLPVEILHSLYPSISQAACANVSPSVLRGLSVDKIQLAMFVSLFADAHSHTEPGDTTYSSHLRPEGFGHILELIQIILGESSSSLRVLERPDPAQYLLLRWGNVVPWSWSTWNDQRVANTECLRDLSATWFFLVHAPMHETRHQPLDQWIFGIDLQSTLLSDVLSSSLMVVQLLKEFLDEKNWNFIPHCTIIRILCKLCWATIQYLEDNILKTDPLFEDLIPQLCESLILLFPVIEIHDVDDNPVRFFIVEALALIPVKGISSSLKKILQNKQFLSKLDETMRCCVTLLSDQGGEKRDPAIHNHFAKSLLNFSSLLLQSAIEDPGLRRTISSFVANLSQSMFRGGNHHSLNTDTLGSFLTVLSILRSRKPETIKIKDENIWSLATEGLNQHLSVPAAFAYYLLTTAAQRRDSLLRHEAWNYLLGVLIRILERQLPEEDEPLALLISPNICFALRSISCHGITRKCLLASPWALTMRLSMQELLGSQTQKEFYFKQLRERIRSEGLKLVNELSDATQADDAHPLAVTMPRLVYHRDCYRSELVPVFNEGS